jgi:ribose transport system permease protein
VTSTTAATMHEYHGIPAWRRNLRLHGWTVGVWLVLLAMVPYWRSLSQQSFEFDMQALAIDALPLCFAAMAQAVVVISGGIDLSVGSLMGLMNVLSAKHMIGMSFREAILFSLLILLLSALAGAFTGLIITLTRIPDIVVTLGMLFVWYGVGLWVMEIPGGGAPQQFYDLALGSIGSTQIPGAAVIVFVALAVLWLPIRWLRPGLSIYAVGSNRNAAYLSGIGVARTRVGAYMLGGVFAGLAGLALTATSGIGDPNSGSIYTLNSVAAVVLGGVSLLGGVGGLIGPIAAAYILTLSKTILLIRGTDPNYAAVYQGLLIIFVVVLGGLLSRKTHR